MLMSIRVKVQSFRFHCICVLWVFVASFALFPSWVLVHLSCSRLISPPLFSGVPPTHYHHLCFSISFHLHLIISLVWFVFKSSLCHIPLILLLCMPVPCVAMIPEKTSSVGLFCLQSSAFQFTLSALDVSNSDKANMLSFLPCSTMIQKKKCE